MRMRVEPHSRMVALPAEPDPRMENLKTLNFKF